MPLLISAASGDLTAAATWGLSVTSAGAELLAPSASTNTTAAYVYSSTFTGTNLQVVDGIALFCNRLTTTGTVTVALSDDNGVTATRSVTVNASDLPADESWVFFKFGVTLTLDGGTDYRVGVLGSSVGNARFYRDATAGNWARILRRTTAPASVAAGDTFLIAGEWTGAGASTARTVTMNSTATTDYGTGVATATAPAQANPQAFTGLQIGQGGTLTWASAGATNYILRLSGNLVVWAGGTYNQGTVATPCPRDSTMVLEFDCAADGNHGFLAMNLATVNIQGQSRTAGKNVYWTLLNTDEAIASTSLGVADDTGWLDNDRIAVASTTRTRTECEAGTLNGNAGASTLTVDGFAGAGGGLAFAHSGTAPTQAEVILLTRNVRIVAVTPANVTYTFFAGRAATDIDWCEFRYHGSGTKHAIVFNAINGTGSFSLEYCSIHDTETIGLVGASSVATIRHNVFFNTVGIAVNVGDLTASGLVVTDNIVMLGGSSGFFIWETNLTFERNRAIGCVGSAFVCGREDMLDSNPYRNCVAHSNAASGFRHEISTRMVLEDCTAWRNNATGLDLLGNSSTFAKNFTAFGNNTQNIFVQGYLLLENPVLNGDTSFATTHGIFANGVARVNVINGNFSEVSGIRTAHTNDINLAPAANSTQTYARVNLVNTHLRAATEVASQASLFFGGGFGTDRSQNEDGFVSSHNHDNVVGQHRTWKRNGRCESDATIFRTAAPSERLTPTSASAKLPSGSRLVAVDSGASRTINVWVRKSVVGDGAAYNGAEPRLILRRNDGVGIAADTVLDTMTAAAGTWEQMTGTTAAATSDGAFEVIVDCDGTAGFVNVDDWSVS